MSDWLTDVLAASANREQASPEWLDGNLPVLIYGTGTMAADIHRVLVNHGVRVHGFVDHKKRYPASLMGTTVFTPANAAIPGIARRDIVVVMGIHNRDADTNKIVRSLHRNGYSRIISTLELYDYFASELGDRYWLTTRRFYENGLPVLAGRVVS